MVVFPRLFTHKDYLCTAVGTAIAKPGTMKRTVNRLSTCLLALGIALAGHAAMAAEDSFVVASVGGPGNHFMPLKPVRDGVVRVDNGLKRAPLRSDMAAVQNGFMRIDRAAARPLRTYRSGTTTETNGVTVLRGGNAAPIAAPTDSDITDLFSAAPAAPDFRSALSGNANGKVRHAWPIAQNVPQSLSSAYGMRKDPFHGQPRFHGGIDIAAATGTPILASAEGTVSKVETGKGLGKYVAVKHRDGTESYYGHLNAQNVRVGQRVMQGQKVGELGSTGRSTGPHLDYRIKKNDATFNPMTVLRTPSTAVAAR